jgi:hypothetical protein
MKLDTELEDLRVMSLLSDLPHEKTYQGRRYVAYAGYVLTYSTFVTVMLWAIAGAKIYHRIWKERPGSIEEAKQLNPQDGRLSGMHDDHVGQYLRDRFRKHVGSMSPDDIESLINGISAHQIGYQEA